MANTVYTESVVTLNASQAEATMNALKSSADELRKKMIEATKLGNTEEAAKYQKQLDSVNKSMAGIKKETKDYSEIMKKLNGSSLNELAKAYSGLNKQIKNLVPGTKEFIEKSKQLKQVKQRMDEINGSVKGTNKTLDALKGMLPKLGIATVFAVAAKAVVQFAKDAVSQTQLVGDRWAQFTHGMRNAYNTFVADLTSGKGWKELIHNMRESYKVGKEVEAMLDEIFERQNSLTLKEAEYNVEIEKNKQIMRDQTKSDQERLDAANEAMRLEKELAEEKKQIAAQEADARKLELQDRTKMTDAELEAYVAGYNQNRDIIQQAQQYNTEIANAEKAVKSLQIAYGMEPNDGIGQLLEQAQQKLSDLKNKTDQTVKQWAEIHAKYQLSNDELVKNYVSALATMTNADAEYYRSTTRIATTASSLKKEISKEHQTQAEEAYKNELAGVDQHQKEMQIKAKEAYAKGEISEQQYQDRLISIQEMALKSKKAIAERYKKDTLEYQSQLLDLTIKQQEEFKKILEQSEADAVKVFEEIAKESEDEIEEIMNEIDADWKENFDAYHSFLLNWEDLVNSFDPLAQLQKEHEEKLAEIERFHEQGLMSEEEYVKQKEAINNLYRSLEESLTRESIMKQIDAHQDYLDAVGNMVSALQDAEMASLDAQMQAELSAAGDNAEERERIEAEYEQKKLDTQKKYAVADMVVNIAKTVAAGALAVMQCFAQLGPIAGAIMAAVVGVTTAAEIATIVAQKNAIMNTTVNSSGSSSSASVGQRVATGYSSGGYTSEASNDYQEVGVVHANEWVAPASMVRSNPIVFRKLEMARKRGTPVSGVSGFADGGMTSQGTGSAQTLSSIDSSILAQLTNVLQYIIDNGIPAYVLLSELNSKQELQNIIKKATGKK